MKIFASYDHKNDNGILIEEIKRQLEEAGHKVWMDTHEKEFGADWRRKISEGVSDSQVTLAFLSDYTHGERSACLSELAIAISIPGMNVLPIMLDAPGTFQVPSTVVMQQWLDLSSWHSIFEDETDGFNEYVSENVKKIRDVIESENSIQFQGEMVSIDKALLPDIREERYRTYLGRKLFGRDWLKKSLSGYISEGTQRFLYITAGPGFGKSHFLADAMHNNPNIVAGYFFTFSKTDSTTLRQCLVSLAYQIASRLPSFRKGLIDNLVRLELFDLEKPGENLRKLDSMKPAKQFEELIVTPFSKVVDGEMENMLIALDGLDEATYHGSNPIMDLLTDPIIGSLPKWVKIVFTCRLEENLRTALASIDAERIDLACEQSEDDILIYFKELLSTELTEGKVSLEQLKNLTQNCEKTFIYADMFMRTYAEDPSVLQRIDSMPMRLNGMYTIYFNRLFQKEKDPDTGIRPAPEYDEFTRQALQVLVANKGIISKNMFQNVLNCSGEKYQEFISTMKSFIIFYVEGNNTKISFYHKAFNEWLTDTKRSGDWFIDIEVGRERIAEYAKGILTTPEGDEEYYYLLPFEVSTFCYEKIKEFYGENRLKYRSYYKILIGQIRFLFFYQRATYNHSLHTRSNQVATEIKKSSRNMREEYERYLPWSEDIRAEVKIAEKEWAKALKILEDAENKYSEILNREIDIYALLERNIAFCNKNIDPDLGTEKLLQLLEFIEEKDYENKTYDLTHTYYHLCVLYYNKKDFATSISYGLKALELAADCHHDVREMSIITDNELAWSYFRLGDYENAGKHFRKSLDDRLEYFGEGSRYTALGYDAMARYLLYQSKNQGLPVSEKAIGYAIKGMNTHEQIFGRQSSSTARSLQTMALIDCYANKLDDAEKYAREAYDIYEQGGEFEKNALNATQNILDEIQKKRNLAEEEQD